MAADELEVSLANLRIGILSRTRKGARFRYDDSVAVDYAGQPLLSIALPVKSRPYSEGLTGAWFSGLLPEGSRLDHVCRQIDCAPGDYMSILAEIGWECAGAVSIAPPGFKAPEFAPGAMLATDELAMQLELLPAFPQERQGIPRVSLGGYQDKLCVVGHGVDMAKARVEGGRFSLPGKAEISTHILKPQPVGRYPHLIESEAWAMAAAGRAARCANAALLDLGNAQPVLCIERFDRIWETGGLRRIHQEDFCQALGLPPEGKYASSSEQLGTDPSYRKIADLLARFAIDAAKEADELLRQATVNLALGNVDAHAKNYALLYQTECSPTISPLYDVAPVFLIEPKAEHLSLRINGKVLFSDVTAEDLVAEGASWRISGLDAQAVVEQTLTNLAVGIEQASSLYPEIAERCAKDVLRRIGNLLGRR